MGDETDSKTDDVIDKEEKEEIVYGSERENYVSQIKSETVTKVESEELRCEDLIEKGEELKKEDSVKDVQQSVDEHISVIDDNKKDEVEKNDVIKNEDVFDVNEKEDVQQSDNAEISVIDECMVSEVLKNDDMEIRKDDVFEKEDIIDVNERVHEQETDDAETSVMDDYKNLEVGKNDIREIKADDKIEKEEKGDDKETRIVNVIENDEQEDIIDLNEIEVEQQTYDVIEKEEKENIVDGSKREDHISEKKSEAVTEVESENSNSKDVIEKGEEFKMADSVEDDKNEYVQQTDDMDISVINDSKKLENVNDVKL